MLKFLYWIGPGMGWAKGPMQGILTFVNYQISQQVTIIEGMFLVLPSATSKWIQIPENHSKNHCPPPKVILESHFLLVNRKLKKLHQTFKKYFVYNPRTLVVTFNTILISQVYILVFVEFKFRFRPFYYCLSSTYLPTYLPIYLTTYLGNAHLSICQSTTFLSLSVYLPTYVCRI